MSVPSAGKKQARGGKRKRSRGDEEDEDGWSVSSSVPPLGESSAVGQTDAYNDMHIEKKKKTLLEEKEAEQASQTLLEKWNRQSSIGLYRPGGVSLFLRRLTRLAESVRTPGLLSAPAQEGGSHTRSGRVSPSSVGDLPSPCRRVKPPSTSATDEVKAITSFTLWLRQALLRTPCEDVPPSSPILSFPSSVCTPQLARRQTEEEEEDEEGPVKQMKTTQPAKKKNKEARRPQKPERDEDRHEAEKDLVSGFRFEPPKSIQVVGSLPLGLLSSFDKNVDIAVEMPAHMFQSKDHLNYRYFTKRFGYLKRLFIHLQSSLRAYEDALSSPCTDGTTTDSSSLPESKARLQKKKKRVSSFSEEPPSDGNNDALKNEARVIFRSLAPEWSPQVGLQYWQGDAVKPIIVIGFAPSLALSSSCHSSSASSAGDAPAASPSALKKKPRGVDLSQWIVRIFPVPPCEDDVPESEGGLPLFKESLLGPHRNCVRRPSFLSWKKGGREGDPKKRKEDEENGHTERDLSENNLELSEEGEEQRDGGDLGVAGAAISTLRPTPYYNGLLLEDMFMRRHSALLHKCCVMFGEPFRTTLQLLKIWALRRSPGVLTLSQSERAVRASAVGSSAEGRARLSSVPATGVNGFTLAMLCGHACLSGGLDGSSPINPRQLLSLTFSFLAEADFLECFYIFGDPEAYSRDTLLSSSQPNTAVRGPGKARLSRGSEEGLAAGGYPGRSPGANRLPRGKQRPSGNQNDASPQDEANRKKAMLAAGLLNQALLFDSPACSCNLLFRGQLHLPELQAMARESLHALEKLEDPFDFLFGAGLPKLMNAEAARNTKKGRIPVPPSLLLANDVQVYVPRISATVLENAVTPFMTQGLPAIADYPPSVAGGGGSRRGGADEGEGKSHEADSIEARRVDFAALDEGVNWEAPPLHLFAEALLRSCVRALGDRLDLVQVRFVHPTCSGLKEAGFCSSGNELSKGEESPREENSALANLPLAFADFEALSAAPATPFGVLLSLRLRGENISRTLDRGPPATGVSSSDEAARSFKAFWGDVVEMRRFQDGQILYTVLWQKDECCAGDSKRSISGPRAPSPAPGGRTCLPLLPPISCACGKVHAPPHAQILSRLFHRHWSHVLALRGQEWVTAPNGEGGEEREKTQQEVTKNHKVEDAADGDAKLGDGPAGLKKADCWMQGTVLGGSASSGGAAQKQMRRRLMQAYAELRNTIHSLSGLPVTVKQVRYADSSSLYVDVFPAPPDSAGPGVEDAGEDRRRTYPVVIEFEDSPAWPEDLTAMKKLKTAFLVEMQKELFDDYSIAGTVTEDHLDVDVGEVSFRIRILQPLEVSKAASLYGDPSCEALTLHLKKLPDCLVRSWNSLETLAAATDSGGGRERDLQSSQAPSVCPSSRTQDPVSLTQEGFSCPTADEVLSTSSFFLANDGQTTSRISEEIKKLRDLRELWWAPQLAASLQTCAMRFPAFTGCLAIVYRWLGEMQLPGLLRLAEHITAGLFIDHLRQGFGVPPQSPHVAFLRFLQVAANFPWALKPFCVSLDPDQPLTSEQERELEASYDRLDFYPSVRTIFDPHGIILPVPDSSTVSRFIRSARSALSRVASMSFGPSLALSEWSEIFTFDWRCFDVVVLLRDPLGAGREEARRSALKRQYANMERCEDSALGLLAPSGEGRATSMRRYLFVRFLQKLRDTYPGALVIGFNCADASLSGGGIPSAIGLKLKLSLLSQQCCSGTVQLQSNKAFRALVNPVLLFASVLSMGGGLVDSIHLVA